MNKQETIGEVIERLRREGVNLHLLAAGLLDYIKEESQHAPTPAELAASIGLDPSIWPDAWGPEADDAGHEEFKRRHEKP